MFLDRASGPGFILGLGTSGHFGRCHATRIGEPHWLMTRISLTHLCFMAGNRLLFFYFPGSTNFAFLAA